MIRRDFIRYLLSAPVAGSMYLYGNPLKPLLREAHASIPGTVIVIFQRGGCDGLNTIIPHGDDEYYNLRPSIGISKPGTASDSAIDLDGFFGLHPSLAPLHSIYQAGHLAVLPTVHYSNASRSHFSSQDFIESGVTDIGLTDGWLNRHIASSSNSGILRAVSIGGLAHSLRGDASVATVNNLKDFSQSSSLSDAYVTRLEHVFNQVVSPAEKNRHLLHEHGRVMLDNLSVLSKMDPDNYQPSGGANYPASGFGAHLVQIAQLVKENVGLEVATVSTGGWDTHSNQGGSAGVHASRLADFASGIQALYTDLQSHMDEILIVTMTEFGRTALQNASGGTDHGNASTWFVAGNRVRGGIHGSWPGLQPDQLYQGRYLAHTVDYRDVLSEVISVHLGNPAGVSSIFPGYSPDPVGILA